MDGRSIFRRARLVIASLAFLLLIVGAAGAVVTFEAPEPAPAPAAQMETVRADVVGLSGATPLAAGKVQVALQASAAPAAEDAPDSSPTTVPTVEVDESTTTTAPPTTEAAATETTPTTAPPTTTTPTTVAPTTTAPPTTTTVAPTTTTTVAATSTGQPSGTNYLSEAEIRSLVAKHFPASEVDKAVLVASCESNWDANAVNSNGPYVGLFQHAGWVWESRAASAGVAGRPWWDPEANVIVSAWLLNGDDWWHWSWCSSWADGQLGG